MASANKSGRFTPAQLEREDKKRLRKAKRLARKNQATDKMKVAPRSGARIFY